MAWFSHLTTRFMNFRTTSSSPRSEQQNRAAENTTDEFSGGWTAVFRWNGCEASIEVGDDHHRRQKTADEIVDEHTTAREALLLEAGLDPSERNEVEVCL